MRRVFADSMYWIALANRHDQWHDRAVRISGILPTLSLVTTQEVLSEFLAHFCGYSQALRQGAVRCVESIQADPSVHIRPQSHISFTDGFGLYKARPDKGYSLTDCISMQAMRQEDITDILTCDEHFSQEGFTIMLRS